MRMNRPNLKLAVNLKAMDIYNVEGGTVNIGLNAMHRRGSQRKNQQNAKRSQATIRNGQEACDGEST